MNLVLGQLRLKVKLIAIQILQWYNHYNIQFYGLDTSQDLVVKH